MDDSERKRLGTYQVIAPSRELGELQLKLGKQLQDPVDWLCRDTVLMEGVDFGMDDCTGVDVELKDLDDRCGTCSSTYQ